MNAIVTRANIDDIVRFRNLSIERFDLYLKAMNAAQGAFSAAEEARATATLGHHMRGASFPKSELTREDWIKSLDAGIWRRILEQSGVKAIMDKKSIETFLEQSRENPVEVTVENVVATIDSLMNRRGEMFREGIANCFSDLDPRFKSHDAFKIGSRIVLTHVFDDWGCWNHHNDKRRTIADIERVFSVIDGERPDVESLISKLNEHRGRGLDPRQSEMETEYLKIRCFKNGNAHLWFQKPQLVQEVNKLLAEHYGEILPDGVDRSDEVFTSGSTAVAKDLSFYPTPKSAGRFALRYSDLRADPIVLEPSAGEGDLIKCLLEAYPDAQVNAVEYSAERVRALRSAFQDNVRVTQANFLKLTPRAEFDAVVMNPPFYGMHWMEHVYHAHKFLKPGGRLIAILPVTARYGESAKHKKFRAWVDRVGSLFKHQPFTDMPLGSFKEIGTNISTTVLKL